MANHTNQVVLITGGASGTGKATAMKLAIGDPAQKAIVGRVS
jgi:NAD(P)-dependent dehydrogenase (short-subunit alcohol dehydrogenase family)